MWLFGIIIDASGTKPFNTMLKSSCKPIAFVSKCFLYHVALGINKGPVRDVG